MRNIIDPHTPISQNFIQLQWLKQISVKVLCFLWKAIQKKIPYATALRTRGVEIDTIACSTCIDGVDCIDHILVGCPFARMITCSILNWCGIQQHTVFQSLDDLLTFAASWGHCPKKKKNGSPSSVMGCYGAYGNIGMRGYFNIISHSQEK